jgi:seryl-tRNA synthetase
MLDIKLIRSEPERVRAALAKRMDNVDLDAILRVDNECRLLTVREETLRATRNELSRRCGTASAGSELTDALRARVDEVNQQLDTIRPLLEQAQQSLETALLDLPNLPHDDVPAGGKEANVVVSTRGSKPVLFPGALDHVALSERLGLVDHARGTKLSGSGFWAYTGNGAALEWALLNYFCQFHYRRGYRFVLPPHLLTLENGVAAGQFPKFRDDVFHIGTQGGDRPRFLLPTAETALLNLYRDEILDVAQQPIKLFSYTPCYRREAGGARSDERGTIRGHQFNKVEMFHFAAPDHWQASLTELRETAEHLLSELGLHFRTSLLAARDTSSSMSKTYDVEVWLPSIGAYKEVSSVSWAGDFQARRGKIRFKPNTGGTSRPVHTLNGSGLATSRLVPALLEQRQRPDGSVSVPEPLRDWLQCDVLTPP